MIIQHHESVEIMRNNLAKKIALGGLLAALAVVIMCLGGMIPLATFVCPMLCAIIQYMVLHFCGSKIAWTWFVAVAILSLLLGPDKEAALVFCLIGCYPNLKPLFEMSKLRFVWKFLFFNISVALLYGILMKLFGMDAVLAEYEALGTIGLIATLVMGNACFFLLDRLLTMLTKKFQNRKRSRQ